MKYLKSRLHYLAAASAVVLVGAGTGAAGAHAATVEVALRQAHDAARAVEDKRDSLAASLDRAHAATAVAESHLAEDAVSAAVGELGSTVTAAASTAEGFDVSVDVPDAISSPPQVGPSAVEEPATVLATSVQEAATQEEAAAQAEEKAAEPVVQNADVQKVLDREKVGLDAVRAATDELERTAEALDAAAAEVDRVTDEVSEATAEAALSEAVADLDALYATADGQLEATFEELTTVGDRIIDPATIEAATDARDALKAEIASTVVRKDLGSVTTVLARLESSSAALDGAMAQVGSSHLDWVDAENARIDAENAELTAEYKAAKVAAAEDLTKKYRAAVAAHQNGWSGAPPGVNYSNGRLPGSELCSISFASGHQLQCDAAKALERANAAYRAETGKNLSFTDSYRSYAAQVSARAAKPATTAVPGTSNHGWGMAVDFDYASARWMAANGADFGWVHPRWARSGGSKPEWWHLEFVAPGVGASTSVDKPDLVSNVKSVLPSLD